MRILVLLLFYCNVNFGQVEDFEGEPLGGNTFTTGGTIFTMSGDCLISEFSNFSCNDQSGVNRYMDTGYLDGPSSGIFGSFEPGGGQLFKVSTSTAQCGWPGTGDGEEFTTGTIRFIGTKQDNTQISEDFTLTTTTYTDLVPFFFSSAIWQGIQLKKMDMEILNGMDYWAMDNLVFESTVLPIKYSVFYAEMNSGFVKLHWETSIEINNEKFLIQFSSDGNNFESLGEVIGNGSTYGPTAYSYEIKNPKNGINYYRLAQIDYSGEVSYSKTIDLMVQPFNFSIGDFYPNPSPPGLITLKGSVLNPQNYQISIFDISGKPIDHEKNIVLNDKDSWILDFSNISPGIYFIKFKSDFNTVIKKLIIAKN